MSKFRVSFILLVLSITFLSVVKSECFINYPDDFENFPRYEKHIGNYRLKIPYNGNRIELEDGETISGFCDTQFGNSEFGKNKTSIELKCKNSWLYYEDNNTYLWSITPNCEKIEWSIYATNETNSWCENNLNSSTILLATKSTAKPHILAGICYNFELLSLQTVNYNFSHNKGNYYNIMVMGIAKSDLGSYQTLTDDLLSFKTTKISELSNEVLQEQLKKAGMANYWLNLANYEVSSIIQGQSYENFFKEYENLLNIIWWHSLRMGNWHRFFNILENYAFNNSFELYTGTSDVVRFPTDQKCEQDNLLQVMIGLQNETIPGYIWTYLKSNDNLNRDFVIVGYNSPYAEFFSIETIIFCPDICSEIPWLSEITSSFRFSFAGIMFCCSTDFVRQTNHLNGFPMDVLLARHLEKNTEIEVTTKMDVTTEIEETTEFKFETINLLKLDNKSEITTYTSEAIFPI